MTGDAWRLDGRVALVTGASKGIGAAVAAALGERGAAVWLVARGSAELRAATDALRARGIDARAVVADVSTDDGRSAVIDAVRAGGDRLDVLVNNVGINIRTPTLEAATADWEAIVRANVTSAWELSRACHPWLAAAGARNPDGAAIVNMSSTAATRAVRTSTAIYAMTKGALEGMTRFLAVDWAPQRIRVNAVQPWYVRTPLAEAVLSDPARAARILDRTPLGRVGEPEDVGRAVAFLTLPASGWITGVSLPVDGGFSVLGV